MGGPTGLLLSLWQECGKVVGFSLDAPGKESSQAAKSSRRSGAEEGATQGHRGNRGVLKAPGACCLTSEVGFSRTPLLSHPSLGIQGTPGFHVAYTLGPVE